MDKLIRYTVSVHEPEEGALLLYNTMNGALLRLSEPGLKQAAEDIISSGNVADETPPKLVKALREKLFLIPSKTDEGALARFRYLESYTQCRTLSFLVYVTDACNFRCVYCPEAHLPRKMSVAEADHFCEEVERSLLSAHYEGLSLSWFGGEPLLNLPIIKRVMERLSIFCTEHGLSLQGGATTNGSLLTEENVSTLLRLGVNQFQITLDGLAETHDLTRPYANGDGSWADVWNNLRGLSARSENFQVILRINANEANAESAKSLILLAEKSLDRRFRITIQPISDMGGDPNCNEYCDLKEGQRIQLALSDYLDLHSTSGIGRISTQLAPFGLTCNSARPNYYIVRTDGGIAKCELNTENSDAVLLEPGGKHMDEVLLAQYVTPSTGACESCRIYPLCFGLICPYKRVKGISCTYAESFLLEESILLLAKHMRRMSERSDWNER